MNYPTEASAAQGLGATPQDWADWGALGLTPDLLPVVSDPHAAISKLSKMQGLGKTPSRFNADGEAVGIPKWTVYKATDRDMGKWSTDSRLGICLQARRVKCFDIDIGDPVQCARVADMIEMTLGELPARGRANSGKRLLAFRLPLDFPKRIIKTAHGNIELLSTGQQFIVCGTHPSGARYEWAGGNPRDLPEVTLAELDAVWQALIDRFALPDGALEARHGLVPTVPRLREDMRDPLVAWLDENGWVTGYQRDGRVDVRCPWGDGHSVDSGPTATSWFPAGVGGFERGHFRCLHASCSNRTDGDFMEVTGYAGADFEPLTEAQVAEAADAAIRHAQKVAQKVPRLVLEKQRERAVRIGREGARAMPTQRVMTGTEMLEECVYITEGARVSFVADPRHVLTLDEFKKSTAGSTVMAKSPSGRAVKALCASLWVEHPERKTVRCQTFAPGRPAVCQSPNDVLAQNLWAPVSRLTPANWRELSAPFFEHVAYLVPEVAERGRFLDWIAHIEQDPGTLPSTHYLLVAKQTGIGRNWLAYALARVFAGHTALGFDLGSSLKSGFNDELSQTLLAVVDELHEGAPGGSSRPAAERLKSMLTEATRVINPKFGRKHVEFNCTRFLMFSNHEAALPLADNDRRVVVIENPDARKSAEYYKRLYALLDAPGFGAALAHALEQRDIADFNPGEIAPMTAAKARTIRAGRSEVEQAVRDVAAEWPSECITSSRLSLAVTEALGGKTWNTQSVCVAAGLVKFPGRVKVGGVAAHVWVLRNPAQWGGVQPAAVAAEVLRGQKIADPDDIF